jgi:hypothetical protein
MAAGAVSGLDRLRHRAELHDLAVEHRMKYRRFNDTLVWDRVLGKMIPVLVLPRSNPPIHRKIIRKAIT